MNDLYVAYLRLGIIEIQTTRNYVNTRMAAGRT